MESNCISLVQQLAHLKCYWLTILLRKLFRQFQNIRFYNFLRQKKIFFFLTPDKQKKRLFKAFKRFQRLITLFRLHLPIRINLTDIVFGTFMVSLYLANIRYFTEAVSNPSLQSKSKHGRLTLP